MDMPFNAPVSGATADSLIEYLNLRPGNLVLDAGCGSGEFLLRCAAETGCRGVGIDNDQDIIRRANDGAFGRVAADSVDFICTGVSSIVSVRRQHAPEEFDAAICIGATHAFATGEPALTETLAGLVPVVKAGGSLLIGEGYWKKDPDPEYLAFLGEPVGIYRSHEQNREFMRDHGLGEVESRVSSLDEWDCFEEEFRTRTESAFASNPNDEKLRARAEFAPLWWDAYQRWGRDTMGFGLYHFRKETE